MQKTSRIYVTEGQSFIGSALLRGLERQGYYNFVGLPGNAPNLIDPWEVESFFREERPEYVFLTAGKSGGIGANQKYPAFLMENNLLIARNVIGSSHKSGVQKLFYLAGSCVYPRYCPQPIKVELLLSGKLEPTNEPYALAKIAGIKLCQAYRKQCGSNFISGISVNVFGPGDNFDLEDSHVVAALMRKIHEAKVERKESIEVWGTGTPRREFIFIDDLADACIFLLENYEGEVPINIGSGVDLSIADLAKYIWMTVGFQGKVIYDISKPDGMPVKLLNSQILTRLGWKPKWSFEDALRKTYAWYLENM